jgi:hypothetical protein
MRKKLEILYDVSLIPFGNLYFIVSSSEAGVLENTTYIVHASTCFFYFASVFSSSAINPE